MRPRKNLVHGLQKLWLPWHVMDNESAVVQRVAQSSTRNKRGQQRGRQRCPGSVASRLTSFSIPSLLAPTRFNIGQTFPSCCVPPKLWRRFRSCERDVSLPAPILKLRGTERVTPGSSTQKPWAVCAIFPSHSSEAGIDACISEQVTTGATSTHQEPCSRSSRPHWDTITIVAP
jgi:hypothetical protein